MDVGEQLDAIGKGWRSELVAEAAMADGGAGMERRRCFACSGSEWVSEVALRRHRVVHIAAGVADGAASCPVGLTQRAGGRRVAG